MKRLKRSTLEREFTKVGFQKSDYGMCLIRGQKTASRIFMRLDHQIELRDARWTRRSNVHVVSYWHWPATLAELRQEIKDIVETYTELCGTRFKETT